MGGGHMGGGHMGMGHMGGEHMGMGHMGMGGMGGGNIQFSVRRMRTKLKALEAAQAFSPTAARAFEIGALEGELEGYGY